MAEAAATKDEHALFQAQKDLILNPHDPRVVAAAEAENIPHSWIDAAQNSPIWDLIFKYEVAVPLHPEYRTLPMVWYIPPLSPIVEAVTSTGNDGEDHKILLSAISNMRIPLDYLAGLFTAGDPVPVEKVLRRLAAMRSYMRDINLGNEPQEEIAQAVGMTGEDMRSMHRLLAIAKYDDRYVIPTASPETPRGIASLPSFNGVDPSATVAEFHGLGEGAPEACHAGVGAGGGSGTISLASWTPGEVPRSMFPKSSSASSETASS